MKTIVALTIIAALTGCSSIGAARGTPESQVEKVTIVSVKQCVAPGYKCTVTAKKDDGIELEFVTQMAPVSAGDNWYRNCRFYPETGAKYCDKFWFNSESHLLQGM